VDREPRKERTISLLVLSVAMKPVTSVIGELFQVSECSYRGADIAHFVNSIIVFVSAASTRAQFPCGQVTLVLGLLLFPVQYAAAEYWLKNSSWSRMLLDTASSKSDMGSMH
jgi:hypothetical protein